MDSNIYLNASEIIKKPAFRASSQISPLLSLSPAPGKDGLLRNFIDVNSHLFPVLARVVRSSDGSISNDGDDYADDDNIYYNSLIHHRIQRGSLIVLHAPTKQVKILARTHDSPRCYAIPSTYRGLFDMLHKTFESLEEFVAWQDDADLDPLKVHMSPRMDMARVVSTPNEYAHLLRAGDLVRVKPIPGNTQPEAEAIPEGLEDEENDGRRGRTTYIDNTGSLLEYYKRQGRIELEKFDSTSDLESIVLPFDLKVAMEEFVESKGGPWTVGRLTPVVQKRRQWVKLVERGTDHPSPEEDMPPEVPLELVQVVAEPSVWVSDHTPDAPAFHLPTRMDVWLKSVNHLPSGESSILNKKKQAVVSILDRCVEHLPVVVFQDILRRGYNVTTPILLQQPIQGTDKLSRSKSQSRQTTVYEKVPRHVLGSDYRKPDATHNYYTNHAVHKSASPIQRWRPLPPPRHDPVSARHSLVDPATVTMLHYGPTPNKYKVVRNSSLSRKPQKLQPMLSLVSTSSLKRQPRPTQYPVITLTPPTPTTKEPLNPRWHNSDFSYFKDRRSYDFIGKDHIASIVVGRKSDTGVLDFKNGRSSNGGYESKMRVMSVRDAQLENGRFPQNEISTSRSRKKELEVEDTDIVDFKNGSRSNGGNESKMRAMSVRDAQLENGRFPQNEISTSRSRKKELEVEDTDIVDFKNGSRSNGGNESKMRAMSVRDAQLENGRFPQNEISTSRSRKKEEEMEDSGIVDFKNGSRSNGGYESKMRAMSMRDAQLENGRFPQNGISTTRSKNKEMEVEGEESAPSLTTGPNGRHEKSTVARGNSSVYGNANGVSVERKANGVSVERKANGVSVERKANGDSPNAPREVRSPEGRREPRGSPEGRRMTGEEAASLGGRHVAVVNGGEGREHARDTREMPGSGAFNNPEFDRKQRKKKVQTVASISKSAVDREEPEFESEREAARFLSHGNLWHETAPRDHYQTGSCQILSGNPDERSGGSLIRHVTVINTLSPDREDGHAFSYPNEKFSEKIDDGYDDNDDVVERSGSNKYEYSSGHLGRERSIILDIDLTARPLPTIDETSTSDSGAKDVKTRGSPFREDAQSDRQSELTQILEEANLPLDGNLYGLSKEGFAEFLRRFSTAESIVQTCLDRNMDGQSFSKMTIKELNELGLRHPLIKFFKGKTYEPEPVANGELDTSF